MIPKYLYFLFVAFLPFICLSQQITPPQNETISLLSKADSLGKLKSIYLKSFSVGYDSSFNIISTEPLANDWHVSHYYEEQNELRFVFCKTGTEEHEYYFLGELLLKAVVRPRLEKQDSHVFYYSKDDNLLEIFRIRELISENLDKHLFFDHLIYGKEFLEGYRNRKDR